MGEPVVDAARASGLVRAGEPLLVLLSGGADSVCLLDVALRLGAEVSALHVDHGLRADSADDADFCRRICDAAGVSLVVERVSIEAASGAGNVQAEARERRYELAERHARGHYATAHTASDQAETVLYRLAVSPGRRALLGMEPRRGRLVRPLLAVTRDEVRDHCRAHGLEWREDPSNSDVRFARARVRHELLAALRELNPAAERTIAETAAALREEHELLEALGALAASDEPLSLAALRELPPALARIVLRQAAGGVALSRRDAERILALPDTGTAAVELPGGLRAVAEYGALRFDGGAAASQPDPVSLPVPGEVRFGEWTVSAASGGDGDALLDRSVIRGALTVRAWRQGDRMRPAGLGGTKTLQDLFTDRKVPRERRATIPVVEADGEIAWVAGVAVDERFRAADGPVVSLSARRST